MKQSKHAVDRQRLFVAQQRPKQLVTRQRRLRSFALLERQPPMEISKGNRQRVASHLLQGLAIQLEIGVALLQVSQRTQNAVAHDAFLLVAQVPQQRVGRRLRRKERQGGRDCPTRAAVDGGVLERVFQVFARRISYRQQSIASGGAGGADGEHFDERGQKR